MSLSQSGAPGVRVLMRIAAALGIYDMEGAGPGMSGLLQPTLDAAPHLGEWTGDSTGVVNPGGTGLYTILTVPIGELWLFDSCWVAKAAGSSIAFDGLEVLPTDGNSVRLMEQTAAITLLYSRANGIWLPAATRIQVTVSAYTSGDTMIARSYIQKFNQLTPARLAE